MDCHKYEEAAKLYSQYIDKFIAESKGLKNEKQDEHDYYLATQEWICPYAGATVSGDQKSNDYRNDRWRACYCLCFAGWSHGTHALAPWWDVNENRANISFAFIGLFRSF